ncbi:type II secretion system F family protein [Cellulomonas fimi]|uniref:Type II secretion system F family protein n=2 Tax=Cellulomonas fimi TaxID=1708 RepID=A0A7Y0LW91_CELFI|nr:type II secretion system F family protein [Cellulomonas fimi]
MVVAGARRTTAPPRAPRPRVRRPRAAGVRSGWARWRWPVVGVAGAAGWAVTGWPVVGPIVAVTVVGLPVLLGTSSVAARRIDRVEAIEEWTRRLADILLSGVGLEQALTASLRTTPAPIAAEIGALVARLSARWPTEQALRALADDLDDASADLVAAALVLASRRRGPGLARVLTAVADSVAEDVAVRRKVEAERAKPRATARAVTFITLAAVAVGGFNGTYLAPYGDPIGQAILALIAAAFVGCLVWMRALTLSAPEPRFLPVSHEFAPAVEAVRR